MEPTLENFIGLIAAREWVTAPVTPESTLAGLGFDYLDLVELVLECEEEFRISIPDDDKIIQTVAEFHQSILAAFIA